MAGLPLHPAHPERVCWGCDLYCPARALACGNGSVRTPHPEELFGPDWQEWAKENAIEVGGPDPSLQADAGLEPEAALEPSGGSEAGSGTDRQCTPFLVGRPCRGNSTT
jgi:hypothetical protein